MQLARGMAADGNGTAVALSGGEYVFTASGTFGGGTVSLDYRMDGAPTFVPLTDIALTGAGGVAVTLAKGEVRVTLTGATAPSVDADIGAVRG